MKCQRWTERTGDGGSVKGHQRATEAELKNVRILVIIDVT